MSECEYASATRRSSVQQLLVRRKENNELHCKIDPHVNDVWSLDLVYPPQHMLCRSLLVNCLNFEV